MSGLLDDKRGRRGPVKLTAEIVRASGKDDLIPGEAAHRRAVRIGDLPPNMANNHSQYQY